MHNDFILHLVRALGVLISPGIIYPTYTIMMG